LVLLFDSKEEEIAQLEEQLKKLKEEKSTAQEKVAVAPKVDNAQPEEEQEEVPDNVFLSERWKEEETSSEGGGGGLTTILGAIGLAVVLAFFSQVPVGQEDLSRYSAIKAPTSQIDLGDLNRARNEGDL
jgi:hypothetical protein